MTIWKNIHPDFTPELQKDWESRGFDDTKCRHWIGYGLKVDDADYAWWLVNIKYANRNDYLKGSEYLRETRGGDQNLRKGYFSYKWNSLRVSQKDKEFSKKLIKHNTRFFPIPVFLIGCASILASFSPDIFRPGNLLNETWFNDPIKSTAFTLTLVSALMLSLVLGFWISIEILRKQLKKDHKGVWFSTLQCWIDAIKWEIRGFRFFGLIFFLCILVGSYLAAFYSSSPAEEKGLNYTLTGGLFALFGTGFQVICDKAEQICQSIKKRLRKDKKELIQEFIQEIPNASDDLKNEFLVKMRELGRKDPLFNDVPREWWLNKEERNNFLRDLRMRWDDKEVEKAVESLLKEVDNQCQPQQEQPLKYCRIT